MFIQRAKSLMKPVATGLLGLVILTMQPSIAEANVGTPLMWVTAFQLFIGNALIGILEGYLLTWIYRIPARRSVPLMILANYFSAWVGWVWLSEFARNQNDLTLYNVQRFLWGMIAAAYVATLWLEWPFVAISIWGKGHDLRRSFVASLFVQSVSYVLLFGWFGMASVRSLLTDVTLVPSEQIPLPPNVRIYYIANEDGDIYSREPSAGKVEKVFDLDSTDLSDCLWFDEPEMTTGPRELVALQESGDFNNPKIVHTGIIVANANCPKGENNFPAYRQRDPTPSSGTATRLGAAQNSPWSFVAGYWPLQGLSGENSKTGEQLRCALEAPFVQWRVVHAILLPTDKVLFQLGRRQTCLLDPEARKLSMLCLGRGAVAVLEPSSLRPEQAE